MNKKNFILGFGAIVILALVGQHIFVSSQAPQKNALSAIIASQTASAIPQLPMGIVSNGDGTYSGTVMKTTINSTNFPGLFSSPVIKTVKASGGDYTTLQAAFDAIGTDAPRCNEVIVVDSGYTAASLGAGQTLSYHYSCPTGTWVWVRPSNYNLLPPQNQTVCSSNVTGVSENSNQTVATFTTSRNDLLSVGKTIRVKGVSDDNFNGDYTVLSVPSPTTFTVANATANAGVSSLGGTMLPMDLYLDPQACPDIPNLFTVAKTGGNTYDQAFSVSDDSSGGGTSSGLMVSGMQIAISPSATVFMGIGIGRGDTADANYVSNVIIDRSYIYSPANTNFVNGVVPQGTHLALVDSYVDGVKDTSGNYAETHGIAIPWAPGPYKIVDNYIGGVPTEIMLTGGTSVLVANAVPSDIEIRTNTLYADFANKTNSLSRKNFIEFKASKRVLEDGNTMEYSWNTNTGSSQYGAALVFNTVASDATNNWNTNQDSTITNNDVQHFGNTFLLMPGRQAVGTAATIPLDTRTLLSNNVFRDWNQQTYDTGLGGNNGAGLLLNPGNNDGVDPQSGADDITIAHNGFYGSPGNTDNFANVSGFFVGGCPWATAFTGAIPQPDLTVHSNITLLDVEFNGDCENSLDGFNGVPGLFPNLNWTGNVHVQNGVGGPGNFRPSDFTTAGPGNQFPNGGASGVAPTGMFNAYTSCTSVPAGPLTSCALQSGSPYHDVSYCDNADCGPNISVIEAAQVRNNDEDTSSMSTPPALPPPPSPTPTPSVQTSTPATPPAPTSTPPATATITLPISAFNFGTILVGTTSPMVDVEVLNGLSSSVTMTSVVVTGPFSISQNYCVANATWNGAIAPVSRCDFYLVFKPQTSGAATGNLSLTVGGKSLTASLTGTGVAPSTPPPATPSPVSPPPVTSAPAPTPPPTAPISQSLITGVTMTNITQTSAQVTVVTSRPAMVTIRYGVTTYYGITTQASPYLTTAYINLTSLSPGTTYNLAVAATPQGSNFTTVSQNYIFTTQQLNGGGSGSIQTTPSSTTNYFSRQLRLGDGGSDVVLLQTVLKNLHFFNTTTTITSAFGPATQHAMVLFQAAHLLQQNGYLDEPSRILMNKVVSANPVFTVNASGTPAISPSVATLPIPAPSVPITAVTQLTRNLSFGSSGTDVLLFQRFLIKNGDYPGPATGYYGSLTQNAVQVFQRKYDIISSGNPYTTGYGAVGPKTRAKINSLL